MKATKSCIFAPKCWLTFLVFSAKIQIRLFFTFEFSRQKLFLRYFDFCAKNCFTKVFEFLRQNYGWFFLVLGRENSNKAFLKYEFSRQKLVFKGIWIFVPKWRLIFWNFAPNKGCFWGFGAKIQIMFFLHEICLNFRAKNQSGLFFSFLA